MDLWRCNYSYWTWRCSIAMLVYWRVAILGGSNNIYIYIIYIYMTTLGDFVPKIGLVWVCTTTRETLFQDTCSQKSTYLDCLGIGLGLSKDYTAYFGNPYYPTNEKDMVYFVSDMHMLLAILTDTIWHMFSFEKLQSSCSSFTYDVFWDRTVRCRQGNECCSKWFAFKKE